MKRISIYATVVLVLAVISLGAGCHGGRIGVGSYPTYGYEEPGPPPWAPAHGYRAKHHYRYYPDSHVYFDVGRGLYFYYSGGDWHASASLPGGIHIDVGDYVTLEMDTDRPYHYDSDVVKRYPPGQMKKMGRGKGKGPKWK
jgi:hypothetical protein